MIVLLSISIEMERRTLIIILFLLTVFLKTDIGWNFLTLLSTISPTLALTFTVPYLEKTSCYDALNPDFHPCCLFFSWIHMAPSSHHTYHRQHLTQKGHIPSVSFHNLNSILFFYDILTFQYYLT